MNELTYWMTYAFIQKIALKRKNEIFVKCYTNNTSILQLFEDESVWDLVGLSADECSALREAKNNLSTNSFLAENLLAQGYDIIPFTSPEYSTALKRNMGTGAPTVLFSKGNKSLMNDETTAIVGSRKASPLSLQFTKLTSERSVSEGKVVVSGGAHGVDQTALDAAINVGGKSIIVLPQGITTFSSKIRQYYKELTQGRLLIVSAFHPNAPWTKEFAMRRNPIIYGMANEVYVAQSEDSGGTWSGVIDGLRRNKRKREENKPTQDILVRLPEENEKVANMLLIQKGATAIDFNGNRIELSEEELMTPEEKANKIIEEKIKVLLRNAELSSKEIAVRLSLDKSDSKVKSLLRKMPFVIEIKKNNRVFFSLKGQNNTIFNLA